MDRMGGYSRQPAYVASSCTRCRCIFFCKLEKNHHHRLRQIWGERHSLVGKGQETATFCGPRRCPRPARLLSQGMASDLLFACSSMTKSFETISEAVRNTKHAFAKADNYTKKPLRNRYERRKVQSYLTLTDWLLGESN